MSLAEHIAYLRTLDFPRGTRDALVPVCDLAEAVFAIDWDDVLYAVGTCAAVSDFNAGYEKVERLSDLVRTEVTP